MTTKVSSRVTINANLQLSEIEIRALDALIGYGIEPFLKVFYTELGKAYLKRYEDGLRSLFKRVEKDVCPAIHEIDSARKLISNASKARTEES